MNTIIDLIDTCENELIDAEENYAWYAPEVATLKARLDILKEVQDAMIANGES